MAEGSHSKQLAASPCQKGCGVDDHPVRGQISARATKGLAERTHMQIDAVEAAEGFAGAAPGPA
mgnify:CR=1 FL=1